MSDDHTQAPPPKGGPARLRRAPGLLFLAFLSALLLACARSPSVRPDAQTKPQAPTTAEESPRFVLDGFTWAKWTSSPEPGSVPEHELGELADECGRGDMGLHEVASEFARHGFAEPSSPDLDLLVFLLRKRGVAATTPEVWVAEMSPNMDLKELTEPFRAWARGKKPRGEYWCGAGRAETTDGLERVVVLRADLLAHVAPILTRIEEDDRPEVQLRFLGDVDSAELVLLSPEGRARHIKLTIRDSIGTGKLPLLSRGLWTVQVMARASGDPRPVAFALIAVGQDPPSEPKEAKVPGEDQYDPDQDPEEAIFALLNGARSALGQSPLRRNKTLDRIARAHSERMLAEGRISHTSGDGTPEDRVRAASLTPKAVGENVALAPSPLRLHRALWASPSHRENLLLTRWDEVGVAIARREDGSLFLTQLFIDSR
ncbi:MAG: hypothetical protein B6A08_01585 [Sorangiineae bacterium NIC37A_2]|nr:MAG: hypothetical protein B6A08_01585 [Sorangiineae bacterium NIC37A_2]